MIQPQNNWVLIGQYVPINVKHKLFNEIPYHVNTKRELSNCRKTQLCNMKMSHIYLE